MVTFRVEVRRIVDELAVIFVDADDDKQAEKIALNGDLDWTRLFQGEAVATKVQMVEEKS
jgi:hypothetical protein